jgi:hypothetical protein
MTTISWKRVAFWGALWWFVYTAPTEDPFTQLRALVEGTAISDVDSDSEW